MTQLVYGFTLSSGAVQLLGSLGVKQAREMLGALWNLWKRNGLLFVDEAGHHVESLEIVWNAPDYPPATRKLMKEFLSAPGMPRAEATDWPASGVAVPQEVDIPPDGSWFVGELESPDWGLDGEVTCKVSDRGIEVCRIDGLSTSRWHDVPTSRVFPKKQAIADALGPFVALCGVAKVLDVVDPYCGKDEVVSPGRSGVVKYLNALRVSPSCFKFKLREVRIYTSKDVRWSMSNAAIVSATEIVSAWKSVRQNLRALGLIRVSLHLIDGTRFGAIAHDRFAQFDAHAMGKAGICAFQVGAGFSVFEGKKLSKQTTLAAVPAGDVARLIKELEHEESHELHILDLTDDG